jgi:D-serine deaminase-like pyridoxal phosphate-dependent protein
MSEFLAQLTGTTSRVSAPIETPIPIVDLATVQGNIRALQDACDGAGLANWPHVKTHKSVDMMRRQLAAGAAGITCQKIGEAEVMADGGATDILISYNILGADKLRRLRALAERVRLTVVCDNEVVSKGLSEAFADAAKPLQVLIELDTGRGRCGVVEPGAAAALALHVSRLPGLSCTGLLAYPPEGPMERTRSFLREIVTICEARGLALTRISSGGTPNLKRLSEVGATEYRSGTSIYNDRQMVTLGAASLEDCAVFVYATVISHPTPQRVILDAGSKSLTSELVELDGYGTLIDYPQARIYKLSEEHGFVDVSACPEVPAVGDVVRVLPNHVCPVVNMFDRVLCRSEDGRLEPLLVQARGRVS